MAKMYENLNAVIYARVSTNDKDQNPEHEKNKSETVKIGQNIAKNNSIWMTRPKRIVLDTMVNSYPKGAVRLDDRAKHKTIIATESEVIAYAKMGYSVRRAAIEYGLPYTTFRTFLEESDLLLKYRNSIFYA